MEVHVLPALSDNYMYLVVDKATNAAAIVDPVEPQKVVEATKKAGVELNTVLTTHHHWDHAGGNNEMARLFPNIRIVGGEDRVDAVTQVVSHGDQLKLGNLLVECLRTPCHTRGHVCYKISATDADIALFTGDTLFIGGCGKFFEGNATEMHEALINIIGKLPDHTKIYCGHEYTVGNLNFAKHVEQDNEQIKLKLQYALKCKSDNVPTVPSTVAEEKQYNPFMRVHQPSVQQHVNTVGDAIATMANLRTEKNNFRG